MRLPSSARKSTLVSLTARTPFGVGQHVVTIHDLFPITNPEWFSPNYVRLHRALLKHHLANAAGISVVSEPVRQQVAPLVRAGTPVIVAPNAPSELGDPSASTLALPTSFFLAVGNLEPRKNLERLLPAYAALPAGVRAEFPLLIAGGSAAAFRAVEGLADHSGAGVQFLGRVSDADLARLYRDATAFVSPSLDEGFGIPVVEAASVARGAMVLSDIPAYRWITEGAEPVFVDPTSIESIRQGLLDATRAVANVGANREIARRFSWNDSARGLADLVKHVGS